MKNYITLYINLFMLTNNRQLGTVSFSFPRLKDNFLAINHLILSFENDFFPSYAFDRNFIKPYYKNSIHHIIIEKFYRYLKDIHLTFSKDEIDEIKHLNFHHFFNNNKSEILSSITTESIFRASEIISFKTHIVKLRFSQSCDSNSFDIVSISPFPEIMKMEIPLLPKQPLQDLPEQENDNETCPQKHSFDFMGNGFCKECGWTGKRINP